MDSDLEASRLRIAGVDRSVGDPEGIRAEALEAVCRSSRSSAAVFYALGSGGLPVRWATFGIEEGFVRRRVEEGIVWPHADPRLIDPSWNRRFLPLGSVVGRGGGLHGTLLHERCHRPYGLHDLLRMVVVHEGRWVGWIGALRRHDEPAFTRLEVRHLAPAAERIADALVEADRLERLARPRAATDLVLRMDGGIALATEGGGGAWTSQAHRTALREWAARLREQGQAAPLLLGHDVRWSRLAGPDGPRLLVRLEPVEPLELDATWVLTPTQRRIARLAAAGRTVDEIALEVQTAGTTVRTHLRQVYVRLRVSTRAELARLLERGAREREGREREGLAS